jgi:tetratricopeptide (TPR) repeat protein
MSKRTLMFAPLFTLAAATPAWPAAPLPDKVVSMRIDILAPEQYRALRDAWRAYAHEHPRDPEAWAELAKAARYAKDPADSCLAYARRAVEVGPNSASAHAVLGLMLCPLYTPGREDATVSVNELERALALDPSIEDPHYTLWVLKEMAGRHDEAVVHLRALVERGHMPEFLLDLAYNMLVAVEPNAVILTNGDNDTYPPLALQETKGYRTDVSIVNLSLLNTAWYRKALRAGARRVPVPPLDDAKGGPVAAEAVAGLVKALQEDGWSRPLYVSTTVPSSFWKLPNKLSLEGVVYRVLPEPGEDREMDIPKMRRNLGDLYRLDSATSLSFDWKRAGALSRMTANYAMAHCHLAEALARSGDLPAARAEIVRGLALCEFHRNSDSGMALVKSWREWDPGAADAGAWEKKFSR